MDLGSDFICEFRARRIRTQITWVTFPGINSPGQASVGHAPGFSGARTRLQWSFSGARSRLQWSTQQASVEHAAGFSGARSRLQWSTQQASVEHAAGFSGGGVLEAWASSDFLRKSWEIPEPVAKSWDHRRRILGNSGNLASHRMGVLDNLYRTCDEWDSIALLFYSVMYRVFIPVGLQYSCDGPSSTCAHPQLNCPIGALSWVAQPIPVVVDYE